jgi:hypothetical protein
MTTTFHHTTTAATQATELAELAELADTGGRFAEDAQIFLGDDDDAAAACIDDMLDLFGSLDDDGGDDGGDDALTLPSFAEIATAAAAMADAGGAGASSSTITTTTTITTALAVPQLKRGSTISPTADLVRTPKRPRIAAQPPATTTTYAAAAAAAATAAAEAAATAAAHADPELRYAIFEGPASARRLAILAKWKRVRAERIDYAANSAAPRCAAKSQAAKRKVRKGGRFAPLKVSQV